MHRVLEEWYELKTKQVFKELKAVRDFLYKKGCKVEKQSSDEFMTSYFILFRGIDEIRNYANLAIRNWVSEEMKRLLGLKFPEILYVKQFLFRKFHLLCTQRRYQKRI